MSTREQCYAALFAALSGLQTGGTIKTADRRLRLLAEVNGSELPALFMTVDRQPVAQKTGTPPKRWLHALVYLYVANPMPDQSASTALNGLIDAVESALEPNSVQVNTLGGVVQWVRIDGTIEVYDAPKGQRAAAVIPVSMLMP